MCGYWWCSGVLVVFWQGSDAAVPVQFVVNFWCSCTTATLEIEPKGQMVPAGFFVSCWCVEVPYVHHCCSWSDFRARSAGVLDIIMVSLHNMCIKNAWVLTAQDVYLYIRYSLCILVCTVFLYMDF